MQNSDVLEILESIATLLELKGENPFKIRAYQNGARALERSGKDIAQLVESGELEATKGIGKALAEKIRTLVTTGALPYYEELKQGIPEGLFAVLKVPGLGPKKVAKLWNELGIESLAELEYACRENRLVLLKGFGTKSQAKVLKGIEFLKTARGRRLRADVVEEAEAILAAVRGLEDVNRAELAGSFRRATPTLKDLDLVVASPNPEALSKRLAEAEFASETVQVGPARTSIRTRQGLGVDFRIVAPEDFPAAWLHFTGSKEHNVALRQVAKERDLKLSEYGLEKEDGTRIQPSSEAELFQALGLHWTPPELREGPEALRPLENDEPKPLVEIEDVVGALHLHTTQSDGAHSLEEMVAAARDLGFRYLGVSEHSKTAVYAHGLEVERLRAQRAEIEALRPKFPEMTIFHGIESDILPDGSLDYPDEVLKELDFVIGSIHSSFQLSLEDQTQRVLKAFENPYLDIFGHPTGRILLGREGYALDMNQVLTKAAETGVVLEINASPSRLDLDYRVIPQALAKGCRLAICPDAHSTRGLADVRWGVDTARKGGAEARHIVNTYPAETFLSQLRRHRTLGP